MAPPKPDPESFGHQVVRAVVGGHVLLYRLTGGRVGGRMGGVSMLLLTTSGRKTGRTRTLPLLYVKTDRGLALIASYGGSDTHPSWYLNLMANPRAEIQLGSERRGVRAEEVAPERREAIWQRAVAAYPDYAVYQKRTERRIPVVELLPAET